MTSLTADVCRITVVAPQRRIDLAVPVTVTVSELMPTLLAAALPHDAGHGGGWVLQRLGGAPFDPVGTPESLDWLEGEELHLRPLEDPLPELDFDDLADGIATAVNRRADRWQPEYRRPLFLALTVAAVMVFGAVLTAGPLLLTVVAGVLAGAGLLIAGRVAEDAALTVVFGAGGAALLVLTGAEAAGAAGMTDAAGMTGPGLAGLLATAGFALVVFAPKVALRMARLRGVQLPKSGEELRYDSEPQPAVELEERTEAADGFLTTAVLGVCLLMPYLLIEILRAGGWIGWLMVAVLSGALALRARSLFGVGQRVALVAAATVGFALVLAHFAAGGPLIRVVLLTSLVVLAGVLMMAAARPWPRRLLPIWEFLATAGDVLTGVALAPLLLQLLGVYGWARGLLG